MCINKWQTMASEMEVCKIVINHVIPAIKINKTIDIELFYDRIQTLLNTYSEISS